MKRAPEQVVEKLAEGYEKSSSSSEFDDVFDVNYAVPSRKTVDKKGESSKEMDMTVLSTLL